MYLSSLFEKEIKNKEYYDGNNNTNLLLNSNSHVIKPLPDTLKRK
jgi:hypothetical protein